MAKKKIEIEVVVDDKGTTKKVALSQKDLEKAIDRSGKATNRATKQQRGLIQTANSGGKNFANLASSITNGIVPAYAVLAAQVFAVTAAFQFLQEAANVRNLIVAQEEYGAVTGVAYSRITKALQEATAGQLRFQEAAQATAIGTAAGLTGDQLVQLSDAAKNASFALGRDLTDSFNRLIRGVTKSEPELLDELGIILRLEPATKAYAASIGKAAKDLNTFEKSQAVANFTIEEAERKFGGIGKVIDDEALAVQKFMKAFDDLSNTIKIALVNVLNPILAFLSQNVLALTGVLSIFAAPLVKSIIPNFEEFGKSAKKASRLARKGLSAATEEVNKAKEASEALVASQEKSIAKAAKLAEKGGISKLGEGQKGGKGALDFLSGASDSKAAQRQAKRVLDGAQKALDKDGIVRRGKLRNFNRQELADLQKSYKLRVQASKVATKQIAGQWQILSAKQKVFAAKTSLAWRKAFVGISKAGAQAPRIIDKAFRFASFAGLALLVFDIGKSMLDAFFPASKAAQKLTEDLGAAAERLEELEGHLARVEKKNFENVLTLNETVTQVGNAMTEANIPKFIEEINLLATAEDKSSEEFEKASVAALNSAKSIVSLDRSFAPLLQALKEGRTLTEAEQKSLENLAREAQNGALALTTLAQAQKDATLEAAKVVQGIPKAPLEGLVNIYKTIAKAGEEANISQTKNFNEKIAKNADRLRVIQDKLSLSTAQQLKDALDVNSANYDRLPITRALLQEQEQISENNKEQVLKLKEQQDIRETNLRILRMLEKSQFRQLEIGDEILDNTLEIAKINTSREDFESRLGRLQITTLTNENNINNAIRNQVSAVAALNTAKIEAGDYETKPQSIINAEKALELAEKQVTVEIERANRAEEKNDIERANIAIEREKLAIFKRQTNELLAQQKRDVFTRFQTTGAGSLGRAGGDIQRDIRENKLSKARSKATLAQIAFEEALNNRKTAGTKANNMSIAQADRLIEQARVRVAEANALVETQLKSIDLQIDSLRLENEKQARLATIISLNPIQREMEEFLLSKGLERKDLSVAQLQTLEEQIKAQQQLKIVTSGLNNIQNAFQTGIENGIINLTGGIGTLKQSFLDLGRVVVQELNRMIAKMIALKIASSVFSAFSPGTGSSAPVAQNMTQGEIDAQLASGGSVVTRYGGFTEPKGYREGGIARGRHAGYGAILHGTEAVIPLATGAKSIPVEFTGRGGQNQNNVTVNVSMASDGTTQTQTSGEDQGRFGKAIAAAVQQEIQNQKRPGGMLSPYGAGSA